MYHKKMCDVTHDLYPLSLSYKLTFLNLPSPRGKVYGRTLIINYRDPAGQH